MKRTEIKAMPKSFRARWQDVVIWKTFWEELEELVLKLVHGAWMSGYRAGLRERREDRAK